MKYPSSRNCARFSSVIHDTLLQRVFVPDDVFASLTSDESVEIAVAVHVHEADVVGCLIVVDDVGGEPALAVVLKPGGLAADVGAGGRVYVTIAVDVADL